MNEINQPISESPVPQPPSNDTTSPPVPVSPPVLYAGFVTRLGAYFVDILVYIFFLFLVEVFIDLKSLTDTLGIFSDYFFWILYTTLFLSVWSTTPGKKMYGLVVQIESGNKLDLKSAFIRAALQPLSLVLFGIGYIHMNEDARKQAWHDKKAHTVIVIRKNVNKIIPAILTIAGFILFIVLKAS